MNMMTSLENIPLKTSSSSINDDSNDPIVKDILNELNSQLNNHPSPPQQSSPSSSQSSSSPLSSPSSSLQSPQIPTQFSQQPYIINNPSIPQRPNKNKNFYYNEEYLRKSVIIVIIIAIFFTPIIFNTLIDKLPQSLASIFNSYDIYIKLILVFISIYLFMIFKLI